MLTLHTDSNGKGDGVKPPKRKRRCLSWVILAWAVAVTVAALPSAGLASTAKPVPQASSALSGQTLQSSNFIVAKKATICQLAPFILNGVRSGALLYRSATDKTTNRVLRTRPTTRKVRAYKITARNRKIRVLNPWLVRGMGATYLREGMGANCTGLGQAPPADTTGGTDPGMDTAPRVKLDGPGVSLVLGANNLATDDRGIAYCEIDGYLVVQNAIDNGVVGVSVMVYDSSRFPSPGMSMIDDNHADRNLRALPFTGSVFARQLIARGVYGFGTDSGSIVRAAVRYTTDGGFTISKSFSQPVDDLCAGEAPDDGGSVSSGDGSDPSESDPAFQ